MSKAIGKQNLHKLKSYLVSVTSLPARGHKVNVTAIAVASGVDRQALYKNSDCRKLLTEAIKEKGLVGIENRPEEDREKIAMERKISQLQQKNDSLYAEVNELRRKLKKYQCIEEMLEQGKRVIL